MNLRAITNVKKKRPKCHLNAEDTTSFVILAISDSPVRVSPAASHIFRTICHSNCVPNMALLTL